MHIGLDQTADLIRRHTRAIVWTPGAALYARLGHALYAAAWACLHAEDNRRWSLDRSASRRGAPGTGTELIFLSYAGSTTTAARILRFLNKLLPGGGCLRPLHSACQCSDLAPATVFSPEPPRSLLFSVTPECNSVVQPGAATAWVVGELVAVERRCRTICRHRAAVWICCVHPTSQPPAWSVADSWLPCAPLPPLLRARCLHGHGCLHHGPHLIPAGVGSHGGANSAAHPLPRSPRRFAFRRCNELTVPRTLTTTTVVVL